jgi:hypothetical protein
VPNRRFLPSAFRFPLSAFRFPLHEEHIMANLSAPPLARLFVALLYAQIDADPCLAALAGLFGPISAQSAVYPLAPFSKYYEKEMGPNLQKCFLTFQEPVAMERLADCKLATHALESRLSADPKHRRFNIDPGLVTSYSVILSTSKNYAHRVYLRDGVYAEVTLIYQKQRFYPLPWTYPDYCVPLALEFFGKARP